MDIFSLKNSAELADMANYETIAAVANVYTIDIKSKQFKNVCITTADAVAKSVALQNVPTRCELYIELTYTNAAAITWFNNITWLSGSAPTFTAGKTYRISFFTADGGTHWHGTSIGGW